MGFFYSLHRASPFEGVSFRSGADYFGGSEENLMLAGAEGFSGPTAAGTGMTYPGWFAFLVSRFSRFS